MNNLVAKFRTFFGATPEPIPVPHTAATDDPFDSLNFLGMQEDWSRFERIIVDQHKEYQSNQNIRALLHAIYLGPDREADFQRFSGSREYAAIERIMKLFGVAPHSSIVEVGGGAGFLCVALVDHGFMKITLFEPNANFVSGTGFLRTREQSRKIKIFNELHAWHRSGEVYDFVMTKSCLHHFMNISYIAASIRQRIKMGALWFVEREWFVDSAQETHAALATHPYCQASLTYEWPYPAYHYVDALELAGFKLKAAVPAGYDNDCLSTWSENPPSAEAVQLTQEMDQLLATAPELTVRDFWNEVKSNV